MTDTASAASTGPERNEKLVSIQLERELDLGRASWDERIFIKVYVAVRKSGLLGAMPPELWQTLCCVATFMDRNGRCFPSQDEIARALNINRSTVSDRIQALARFRFRGEPVLLIEHVTEKSSKGPRFASNRYTIMPSSKMRIFDQDPEKTGPTKKFPVSRSADTGKPDTVKRGARRPDTNNI